MSNAKHQNGCYYIEVRPIAEYKNFRMHEVSGKNGIERVGGQREDGSWETVKWLVSGEMAHVENGRLVADHAEARELFAELDSEPELIEGNRFKTKERAAGQSSCASCGNSADSSRLD